MTFVLLIRNVNSHCRTCVFGITRSHRLRLSPTSPARSVPLFYCVDCLKCLLDETRRLRKCLVRSGRCEAFAQRVGGRAEGFVIFYERQRRLLHKIILSMSRWNDGQSIINRIMSVVDHYVKLLQSHTVRMAGAFLSRCRGDFFNGFEAALMETAACKISFSPIILE